MRNKLKEILEKNKDKITIIEECKSEKSKNYNDDELFVLWEYYMRQMNVPKFCNCFDLTREEYAYCIAKIFGKKSAKYFLEDSKNSESWKEKSHRRMALDIITIYNRRGRKFLNDIPKAETFMQKKYLEVCGELNKEGKLLLSTLIEKEK